MTDTSPFRPVAAGLCVSVRLQPGAKRDRVEGLDRLADGAAVLKARVTAPPEDGKANRRLIALLAKAWRLPKGQLEIVSGTKDRRKTILVKGDSQVLLRLLEDWLAAAGKP